MDICLADTSIYPGFCVDLFMFQLELRSSMKKHFLSPSKGKEII